MHFASHFSWWRILIRPLLACSETKDLHDSPISPPGAHEPAVRPVDESSPAPQGTATEEPQIVSNARGPFPQLELYSVPPPRRSNTMHGTGHRRDASWGTFGGSGMSTQAGRVAAADSIVRRLGDVSIPIVPPLWQGQRADTALSFRWASRRPSTLCWRRRSRPLSHATVR